MKKIYSIKAVSVSKEINIREYKLLKETEKTFQCCDDLGTNIIKRKALKDVIVEGNIIGSRKSFTDDKEKAILLAERIRDILIKIENSRIESAEKNIGNLKEAKVSIKKFRDN